MVEILVKGDIKNAWISLALGSDIESKGYPLLFQSYWSRKFKRLS